MKQLFTKKEAVSRLGIPKRIVDKLIDKGLLRPEQEKSHLYFTKDELDALKGRINKEIYHFKLSKDWLTSFPSKSVLRPRDGGSLKNSHDILFKLKTLSNLSDDKRLIFYRHLLNQKFGFIYLIQDPEGNLFTPLGLKRFDDNKFYFVDSFLKRSAILAGGSKDNFFEMRDILHRVKASYQSYENTGPRNDQHHIGISEAAWRETVEMPRHEALEARARQSATILINNLVVLENDIFNETNFLSINSNQTYPIEVPNKKLWEKLIGAQIPLRNNFFPLLFARRTCKAICPLDGPVSTIEGDFISPKSTWSDLMGRHWRFTLCPRCLGTFRCWLYSMN